MRTLRTEALQSGRDIVERAYLLSLGTADADGPWVSDVLFVCDEEWRFYWASSPQARHSRAIAETGRAAAAVTASRQPGQADRGVQLAGSASALENDVDPAVVARYTRKYRVDRAQLTGAPRSGFTWYILVPSCAFLIDTANAGRPRQQLDVPLPG